MVRQVTRVVAVAVAVWAGAAGHGGPLAQGEGLTARAEDVVATKNTIDSRVREIRAVAEVLARGETPQPGIPPLYDTALKLCAENGEAGAKAAAELMEAYGETPEVAGTLLAAMGRQPSATVDAAMIAAVRDDPQLHGGEAVVYFGSRLEKVHGKTRGAALEAVWVVVRAERVSEEMRGRAAMLIAEARQGAADGEADRKADRAAFRKMIDGLGSKQALWERSMYGRPWTLESHLTLAAAKLGDAAAKAAVVKAAKAEGLKGEEAMTARLWGMKGLSYVGDPADVAVLMPYVRSDATTVITLYDDGMEFARNQGPALDVLAVEAIHGMVTPSPAWSFKVGEFFGLGTESKGVHAKNTTTGSPRITWQTLSEAQRKEVEAWYEEWKKAAVPAPGRGGE